MLIPNHSQCEYNILAYDVYEGWTKFNLNPAMEALENGDPYPGLWQAPRSNEVPYTPIDPQNLQLQTPEQVVSSLEYQYIEKRFEKKWQTRVRQRIRPGTIVQLKTPQDRQAVLEMSMEIPNPNCPWPYVAQYKDGKLTQLEDEGSQTLGNKIVYFDFVVAFGEQYIEDATIILVIPDALDCRYELQTFQLSTSVEDLDT